jgi:hypothetical protein
MPGVDRHTQADGATMTKTIPPANLHNHSNPVLE